MLYPDHTVPDIGLDAGGKVTIEVIKEDKTSLGPLAAV